MKKIKLRNEAGEEVGIITIVRHDCVDRLPDTVVGAEQCGNLIRAMHHLPQSYGFALLELPGLKVVNKLNRSNCNMDIFNNMVEKVASAETERDAIRLVCPSTERLPQDGMLEYVTIEAIGDLLATHGSNVVFMFHPDNAKLLKCFVEFSHLFGQTPTVISGVPEVNYDPDFENVTWSLHRVAYHSVVNDLLEVARRDRDMSEDKKNSSIYEREKATYTRKTGETKRFTAFDVNAKPASADDEATAEDEGH